jgi:uncharacterized membrane protein (Fun14 family)
MGIFNKLGALMGKKKDAPLDVSETVSKVVGGGIIGFAVGEGVEEIAKVIKKKPAAKKVK